MQYQNNTIMEETSNNRNKILLVRGCINEYLGINNTSEVNMTNEERTEYFNQIVEYMKTQPIDEFFNSFLVWFCENFGIYWRSEKPCENCGDYSETYELTI